MSEMKAAVDRLLWLCEEAEKRTEEVCCITLVNWLFVVSDEILQITGMLQDAGILEKHYVGKNGALHVPFIIQVERTGKGFERETIWHLLYFDPLDIDEDYEDIVRTEKDRGATVRWTFSPRTSRHFCIKMRQWGRLLKLKAENLRTLSTDMVESAVSPRAVVKAAEQRPRKNGRPPRAELAPKQLEAIHRRRLNGESLTSIFRSYTVDFSYDTFRRLYHNWRDNQGEGQRSREQKRR